MSNTDTYVEIQRLVSLYCTVVDNGDGSAMAGLFVPGGRLVVYSPGAIPDQDTPLRQWESEDGFAGLIAYLRQSYVRWFHFLGGHWSEPNGDVAHGETYLMAHHLCEDADGSMREEIALIRYYDTYVREENRWKFKVRNAVRQWTNVHSLGAVDHKIDVALQRPAS